MDNGDLLNTAFDRYERMKILDKISGYALHRMSGDRDLDLQDRRLSILSKKRMLGLPESTEDLEEAINEDKSFYSNLGPGLGRRVLQTIPEPFSLKPHYKVAHSVADMLPSSIANIAKAGSAHGPTGLRRAARFLFSL